MFIKKCIFLIFMVSLTIGIIIIVVPSNKLSYLYANVDKHERLKSILSPKIVMIGGSHVAFSIDSKKIEKAFAIPTVNMALHAGIGLRYMLNEVKDCIGSGDIILVIPEYDHFFNEYSDRIELLETALSSLGNLRYLGLNRRYIKLLKEVPSVVQERLRIHGVIIAKRIIGRRRTPKIDEVYSRSAFNVYGDVIGHLNKKPELEIVIQQSKSDLPNIKRLHKETIKMLNDFYSYASDRNARVFFDFPGVPYIYYENNKEKINSLYERLNEELKIPIIGQPENYAFPLDSFFDTMYHANAKGRELRTQRVIADIMSRKELGIP